MMNISSWKSHKTHINSRQVNVNKEDGEDDDDPGGEKRENGLNINFIYDENENGFEFLVARCFLKYLLQQPKQECLLTETLWKDFYKKVAKERGLSSNGIDSMKPLVDLEKFFEKFKHIFLLVPDEEAVLIKCCAKLNICKDHLNKEGCTNKECGGLHCCKYFINHNCKFKENCSFGHDLSNGRNRSILQNFCIKILPETDFSPDSHLSSFGCLNLNEVSLLLKQECPRVCKFYNSELGCKYGFTGTKCPALHVCKEIIFSDVCCDEKCKLIHSFTSPQPQSLLLKHGYELNENSEISIKDEIKLTEEMYNNASVVPSSSTSSSSSYSSSFTYNNPLNVYSGQVYYDSPNYMYEDSLNMENYEENYDDVGENYFWKYNHHANNPSFPTYYIQNNDNNSYHDNSHYLNNSNDVYFEDNNHEAYYESFPPLSSIYQTSNPENNNFGSYNYDYNFETPSGLDGTPTNPPLFSRNSKSFKPNDVNLKKQLIYKQKLSDFESKQISLSPQLKLCKFYNSDKGCNHNNKLPSCPHLHLCQHFLAGTCSFGHLKCKRSHNVEDPGVWQILQRYGIDTTQPASFIIKEIKDKINSINSKSSNNTTSITHSYIKNKTNNNIIIDNINNNNNHTNMVSKWLPNFTKNDDISCSSSLSSSSLERISSLNDSEVNKNHHNWKHKSKTKSIYKFVAKATAINSITSSKTTFKTLANTKSREIMSFVFMDLEATGLQHPHITELSLVALNRSGIKSCQDTCSSSTKKYDYLPRVLNKLTLCTSPTCPIEPTASEMTGLFNKELDFQKPFDSDLADIFSKFLTRLQPPVCLVAHNGYRFDFPLLQAELSSIKKNACIQTDLLCLDSLVLFRSLDDRRPPLKEPLSVNESKIISLNDKVFFFCNDKSKKKIKKDEKNEGGDNEEEEESMEEVLALNDNEEVEKLINQKGQGQDFEIKLPITSGIESKIPPCSVSVSSSNSTVSNVTNKNKHSVRAKKKTDWWSDSDENSTILNSKHHVTNNLSDDDKYKTEEVVSFKMDGEVNFNTSSTSATSVKTFPSPSKTPSKDVTSPSKQRTDWWALSDNDDDLHMNPSNHHHFSLSTSSPFPLSDYQLNHSDKNLKNNLYSNLNNNNKTNVETINDVERNLLGLPVDKATLVSKETEVKKLVPPLSCESGTKYESKLTNPKLFDNPSKILTSLKSSYHGTKPSYKLSEVHRRITGKYPEDSHRAEDDALTLMRCFLFSEGSLLWADKNASRFLDVVPMDIRK